MKLHERINCILLGTLWTLAIVLVLDFWLNTSYNFNMFSATHWQFVANLQASHRPISTGFYIAITLAITACIFGLFMLFRPKFRKIILQSPQQIKEQAQPETIPEYKEEPMSQPKTIDILQPTIQRPPHLHIQQHQKPITPPKTAERTTTIPTPQGILEPRYTQEMQKIFEDNGYRVLKTKPISKVPLSLVALGTGETLWIGACDISHEQMADVMLALKNVFQETLEDIEIDINSFIINPTDDTHVDAILDFKSIDDLATDIAKMPNESDSDADQESGSMDAFAGYIETVLTYLGNK